LRKRLWVLAGVGIVLAAGASATALALLHVRSPRIDREHFDRIAVGMGQPDVEAIMGGPPGDYTDRHCVMSRKWFYFCPNAASYLGESYEEWLGDGGVIVVTLDKDHRVTNKAFHRADDGFSSARTTAERLEHLSQRLFGRSWP
jgi:hypothetical protein